jgi:ribosomal small subunit protein bTHX
VIFDLDLGFTITFALLSYSTFSNKNTERPMGRGDAKTKRGKITRGSHGKSRPKLIKLKTLQKNQAKATDAA